MTEEELIKILEDYEIFVDDDYGGSYQSIIYYDKEKKVSKAHTTISALKIIETFNNLQKENKELNKKLQKASDEFLKYDWANSTVEQCHNQLKNLYEAIFRSDK